MNTLSTSELFNLQIQVNLKRIEFYNAINNQVEFSIAKLIYMELKKLENMVAEWKQENMDYSN